MLLQLDIHNVALIEDLSIELGNGLNILTGETGAGKSIIIDSINSILGDRVSRELIRSGTEKARVEAVFSIQSSRLTELLEDAGIEPETDNTLIISREFTVSGKNVCRVNGKIVTLSMLKEIGENIIDIHGQHDNQSLLRPERHVLLLDLFGGNEIQVIKNQYLEALSDYRDIKKKLSALSGDQGERERRIDLLEFQVNEITKAKLKTGEDEELNRQRLLLANSGKIVVSLSKAYELLMTGYNNTSPVTDGLGDAIAEFAAIENIDGRLAELSDRLKNISYQLDDIASDIRGYKDEIEFQPDLLEQVDERIDLITRLKRKYGRTIEEILEYCRKAKQELEEIRQADDKIKELSSRLKVLDSEVFKYAHELSSARVIAAGLLETRIGSQLEDLEMKRAKFKVDIRFNQGSESNSAKTSDRRFTSNGLDEIEFLISPNVGEPLKPLSKIASGGELSRIMLAIKTILADIDMIPTLIFDEIDIGISGRAAQKVAEKLSYVSRGHQVLCVTHLAQIASMADNHFLIRKEAGLDSTVTFVEKLDREGVKNEIARMLGGSNISQITLEHAEEMLENSAKLKKQ